MARPCKIIDSHSRHNTKEEIEKRKAAEESIKGADDKIKILPGYLNKNQKDIYLYIITELENTGMLQNLDVYILSICSIAVDRLISIESIINNKPTAILNKDLMSAKDKYTKDLYRCCNELSLSPQSRAKLGSLALNNKENKEDPILKILQGDFDDTAG